MRLISPFCVARQEVAESDASLSDTVARQDCKVETWTRKNAAFETDDHDWTGGFEKMGAASLAPACADGTSLSLNLSAGLDGLNRSAGVSRHEKPPVQTLTRPHSGGSLAGQGPDDEHLDDKSDCFEINTKK